MFSFQERKSHFRLLLSVDVFTYAGPMLRVLIREYILGEDRSPLLVQHWRTLRRTVSAFIGAALKTSKENHLRQRRAKVTVMLKSGSKNRHPSYTKNWHRLKNFRFSWLCRPFRRWSSSPSSQRCNYRRRHHYHNSRCQRTVLIIHRSLTDWLWWSRICRGAHKPTCTSVSCGARYQSPGESSYNFLTDLLHNSLNVHYIFHRIVQHTRSKKYF